MPWQVCALHSQQVKYILVCHNYFLPGLFTYPVTFNIFFFTRLFLSTGSQGPVWASLSQQSTGEGGVHPGWVASIKIKMSSIGIVWQNQNKFIFEWKLFFKQTTIQNHNRKLHQFATPGLSSIESFKGRLVGLQTTPHSIALAWVANCKCVVRKYRVRAGCCLVYLCFQLLSYLNDVEWLG